MTGRESLIIIFLILIMAIVVQVAGISLDIWIIRFAVLTVVILFIAVIYDAVAPRIPR